MWWMMSSLKMLTVRHQRPTTSFVGLSGRRSCRFFTTSGSTASSSAGADHGRYTAAASNRAANFLFRAAVLSGTGSALFGLYSWGNSGPTSVVHAHQSLSSTHDPTKSKLILYQYQTCPFCCKVRAFLDYNGLPYQIVEVNPVFRQQIKFSKWRKVPILIVEGQEQRQQLNDSSLIISLLSSLLFDQSKSVEELITFYPVISHVNERGKKVDEVQNRYHLMYMEKLVSVNRSEEELAEERKWRMWVDDHLVHMLSPNVYRSPSEALQAFRWFSAVGGWEEHFSFFERAVVVYFGAAAMYFLGKRLKKRHMLKDDVRESLYDVCHEWLKAVGTQRTFMGGDKPNLADLAVYGVLSSIEGCHAFNDVLQNTDIQTWFLRMKASVSSHSGSSQYESSKG